MLEQINFDAPVIRIRCDDPKLTSLNKKEITRWITAVHHNSHTCKKCWKDAYRRCRLYTKWKEAQDKKIDKMTIEHQEIERALKYEQDKKQRAFLRDDRVNLKKKITILKRVFISKPEKTQEKHYAKLISERSKNPCSLIDQQG